MWTSACRTSGCGDAAALVASTARFHALCPLSHASPVPRSRLLLPSASLLAFGHICCLLQLKPFPLTLCTSSKCKPAASCRQ